MIVTAETYRAAADRLHHLARLTRANDEILAIRATAWGIELRGAAEALEHHDCQRARDAAYSKGYNDASEVWEPLADYMAQRLHEAIPRLQEPTPGLDDLDRVLADLRASLTTYERERPE